jgi:uncharacterized membrane protein YhfC
MVLLSISIVLALLITIGLPIGVALWFKKKYHLPWRIFSYGALAYFLAQALVSILVTGFVSLVGSGTIVLSDQSLYVVQIVISVLLTAVMGVIIRWFGMKHLNEDLDNLKSAYGIGIGFGGIESIMLVGIPLLATFIPMIRNTNIDPQTTTLEPEVIVQIEELWQVSPIVPLAGALERIAAFVLHITVTILVLQIFKRKSKLWMAAAIGLEVLVNGSIVGLAESGISYGWVTLISMVFMAANIFILLKLGAFAIKDIDEDSAGIILEEQQAIEEQDL